MQQTIEANPAPENPKHKIWGIVLKVIEGGWWFRRYGCKNDNRLCENLCSGGRVPTVRLYKADCNGWRNSGPR